MKPAAVNRPPRKAACDTCYKLEELSPRLQRELLRRDLGDNFSEFVRAVSSWLHPGETYLHTWHIDLLCDVLARGRGGKRLRKIINLPPRSLKSIIVSVALPAWLMGHDRTLKIIVVSYSDELARKLSRDFRTVVESEWYRGLFPAMVLGKKNTEIEITTTENGHRYATSTGGTLTGRGAGILILDDPIKPVDAESDVARSKNNEWFDSTLFSPSTTRSTGRSSSSCSACTRTTSAAISSKRAGLT
jgi:hypothetical protein